MFRIYNLQRSRQVFTYGAHITSIRARQKQYISSTFLSRHYCTITNVNHIDDQLKLIVQNDGIDAAISQLERWHDCGQDARLVSVRPLFRVAFDVAVGSTSNCQRLYQRLYEMNYITSPDDFIIAMLEHALASSEWITAYDRWKKTAIDNFDSTTGMHLLIERALRDNTISINERNRRINKLLSDIGPIVRTDVSDAELVAALIRVGFYTEAKFILRVISIRVQQFIKIVKRWKQEDTNVEQIEKLSELIAAQYFLSQKKKSIDVDDETSLMRYSLPNNRTFKLYRIKNQSGSNVKVDVVWHFELALTLQSVWLHIAVNSNNIASIDRLRLWSNKYEYPLSNELENKIRIFLNEKSVDCVNGKSSTVVQPNRIDDVVSPVDSLVIV